MSQDKSPAEIRTHLDLSLPVSYSLEPCADSNRGLLVLHGYEDHARAARRRLLGSDSVPGFTVFSPNGLFPCPSYDGTRYKEAYAWYFKDPHSNIQMISPEFAADALIKLIEKVELSSLQWTILAFS